jgi:hypothetical protein
MSRLAAAASQHIKSFTQSLSSLVQFAMDYKSESKNSSEIAPASGVMHQEIAGGGLTHHGAKASATREPYGPAGFRGLFSNGFVACCAMFATIGGLLFGYE